MDKLPKKDDPAMTKVRQLWAKKQKAGMTMQELGEKMGYGPQSARQGVSQLLKSRDPQIGTLRKFASAIGVALTTLVRE